MFMLRFNVQGVGPFNSPEKYLTTARRATKIGVVVYNGIANLHEKC